MAANQCSLDSKSLLDELNKILNEDQLEENISCCTCSNLILKLHKHVLESHGSRGHTSQESSQLNMKRISPRRTRKRRNHFEQEEVGEESNYILPHNVPSDLPPAIVAISTTDPPADRIDPEIKIETEVGMVCEDYSEFTESSCPNEEETEIEIDQCLGPDSVTGTAIVVANEEIEGNSCRICEYTCVSRLQLRLHFEKSHPGQKPYACGICKKTFSSKQSLKDHTRTIHTKDDSPGPVPDSVTLLVAPNNKRTEGEPCKICTNRFATSKQLKLHFEESHPGEHPYTCEICKKTLFSASTLRDHTRNHTGQKLFMCEICGKEFNAKSQLVTHTKCKHTEERPHTCSVCGKGFISLPTLNKHMIVHSGEKSFVCEVCGKGFLRKKDVMTHMMVHSDKKSFVCSVCGSSFKYKDALDIHMRTHSGERPYVCTICHKGFTSSSVLGNHVKSHGDETPYVCEICSKAFKTRGTLHQHMRVHKRTRPSCIEENV